jgi:hypothetical protein
MSKTAIIKTGESFFMKQISAAKPIKLDQIIFANVPGVDGNTDINVNATMPAANQIVHRAPVTQSGLINDRTVVYSIILDTNVGDFSFNYFGLVNAETNTLCLVMHTDLTRKIKTVGQQQGNTITESIWLEMDNASASTGITVNAQTWQIDFSKRLAGEDESIRTTNLDLYGRLGITDGFSITKSGNNCTVSAGVAYVAGLRVNHVSSKTIAVANGQSIYIDAWLDGTTTGAWTVNYNILSGANLKDYKSGVTQHYVECIASVDNSGNLKNVVSKKVLTTVDLDSSTNSAATNKAATPAAVREANSSASNANALANTANTTANIAKNNAANAQSKADSAYSLANTANNAANSAKSIAETDATVRSKGRVQLNSDVNSTAENLAATPLAVKKAYDLASSKLSVANFAASLSTSGYQKLPNGLIFQWGYQVSAFANRQQKVTFPVSFPSDVFIVLCNNAGAMDLFDDTADIGCFSKIKTSFQAFNYGDKNPAGFHWIAIGR